jgi:hypothetical protein
LLRVLSCSLLDENGCARLGLAQVVGVVSENGVVGVIRHSG